MLLKPTILLFLAVIASYSLFGQDVVEFPHELSFSTVEAFILDEQPLKLFSEKDIQKMQIAKNRKSKDSLDKDSEYVLSVFFQPALDKNLEEYTRKYLGEFLVLEIDKAIILYGRISEVIPNGRFFLTLGNYAVAKELVSRTKKDKIEWWEK